MIARLPSYSPVLDKPAFLPRRFREDQASSPSVGRLVPGVPNRHETKERLHQDDSGLRINTSRRRWFPLHQHDSLCMMDENITRLLVVDDNVDVRFAMYECLSGEGFDVSVAENGLHGIALARMIEPQAILLDIGMPALDGFSTARAMRGIPTLVNTPMIAVTGFFDKAHFDDAKASGFDFYFQKPVEMDALLDLLKGRRPE